MIGDLSVGILNRMLKATVHRSGEKEQEALNEPVPNMNVLNGLHILNSKSSQLSPACSLRAINDASKYNVATIGSTLSMVESAYPSSRKRSVSACCYFFACCIRWRKASCDLPEDLVDF